LVPRSSREIGGGRETAGRKRDRRQEKKEEKEEQKIVSKEKVNFGQ
jgi:hypothetical protein